MPFKRCVRCGKEYLAKTDSQELCSPTCSGPKGLDIELTAKEVEGRWWVFPLFFLFCCAVVAWCYFNAFDVELYLVVNFSPLRPVMASKLVAGCPDSLEHVLEGVSNQNPLVCKACLDAMDQSDVQVSLDHPVVPSLMAELKAIFEKEPDVALKAAAIRAMGCIDDPELIPTLRAALTKPKLARAAVMALKKMGTERAIDPICDVVRDDGGVYRRAGDTRYHAVIALGLIADPDCRAAPILLETLRDPSGPIRDEALTAISKLFMDYTSLTMTGKDRCKEAITLIRRYTKADRQHAIRDHGARVIDQLEKASR